MALLVAEVVSKIAIVALLATAPAETSLPKVTMDGPLVGKWRAVQFAKDLDGTDSGITDLWVRELDFRGDGTLAASFSDGQSVDRLHLWHDMTIELYGQTPDHRDRKTVEVVLQGERLFLPWCPQGTVVGYYVLEKALAGGATPSVDGKKPDPVPLSAVSEQETKSPLVGTWRRVDYVRDFSGAPGKGEPGISALALSSDGSVEVTFADGEKGRYLHRWYEDMRFEWCANMGQAQGHRTQKLTLREEKLFLEWNPFTPSNGFSKSLGYCVFEKESDADPGPVHGEMAVDSTNTFSALAGTWRLADLVDVRGRSVDENPRVATLELARDASATARDEDGRRLGHAEKWGDDMRIRWCGDGTGASGYVTEGIALWNGLLFVPWRHSGGAKGYRSISGCYVFEKVSGEVSATESESAHDPTPVAYNTASRQGLAQPSRAPANKQQLKAPPPPLLGEWRAVQFARDLEGTYSGISKLWLRRLEFRENGTLAMELGDGQFIEHLHRWQGMTLEWYGNARNHPEYKKVKMAFRGAQLFVPWCPQGRVVGYYVFEKPGYVPPRVSQPRTPSRPRRLEPPVPPPKAEELTEDQKKLRTDVEALSKKALEAIEKDDLTTARETCAEALEKCGDDQAVKDQAAFINGMVAWLDLTEDPSARFVVGAAMGAGDETMLRIFDVRDGGDFTVKPGQEFAGFRLDSYSSATKKATISAEERKYTIAWE